MTQARVTHLFVKPHKGAPMQPRERLRLLAGKGIQGDAAFGRPRRQVLLVSAQVLERFRLNPADLRENITIQGLEVDSLEPGTHLKIGAALLEISGPCRPCGQVERLQPGLQGQIAGKRGMLARVVKTGTICIGDSVIIERLSREQIAS
jgi:MOSC domain-containing protein YiiM